MDDRVAHRVKNLAALPGKREFIGACSKCARCTRVKLVPCNCTFSRIFVEARKRAKAADSLDKIDARTTLLRSKKRSALSLGISDTRHTKARCYIIFSSISECRKERVRKKLEEI